MSNQKSGDSASASPIRVVVIDPIPLRCLPLRRAIAADKRIKLTGAFGAIGEAAPMFRFRMPDVIVIASDAKPPVDEPLYLDLDGRHDVVILDLERVVANAGSAGKSVQGSGTVDLAPILNARPSRDVPIGKPIAAPLPPKTIARATTSPRSTGSATGALRRLDASTPIIAIGASTGGVDALGRVLATLPTDCPPVVICQHIRHEFTLGLTERLDKNCAPHVVAGTEGMELKRGLVIFAPGSDHHLEVVDRGNPRCHLREGPPETGHQPSVDVMFDSLVPLLQAGRPVLAALLTGMGADGANGMVKLRKAGALTIAQDEATSVVYGMPRVAAKRGGACQILPLDEIGPTLVHLSATPSSLREALRSS